MDIRVLGSNMGIGTSLTNHVKERLDVAVRKYFENAVNADVFFTKNKNSFKANIVINEGVSNISIRSNSESEDVYSCFENALEKAIKQLRRYKNKMKTYRRSQGGFKSAGDKDNSFFEAPKYIIPSVPYALFEEIEEEERDSMNQEESLKIIEERKTKIEELTVDQAIMKMDLFDVPALVFINKQNNRVNVVYNRKDGNVSWIDPVVNQSS